VGNEHGLGTDPVPVPWAKLSGEQLREKMGILLAVRDPSGRPPATTPASPASRFFVFENDAALYRFEEVGMRLTALE
jgi:hypothetical protein